mmetsp:Transcript_19748/g.66390  ORF Transcript_19748/g.66390 Transcript_19748/m.66390 type:complete len:496 (-) Transcript_19748:287-1774(-)
MRRKWSLPFHGRGTQSQSGSPRAPWRPTATGGHSCHGRDNSDLADSIDRHYAPPAARLAQLRSAHRYSIADIMPVRGQSPELGELLGEGLEGVVDGRLKEAKQREEAADDGAQGGDKVVGGHGGLLLQHLQGGEVVNEFDGREHLGRLPEVGRVHRVRVAAHARPGNVLAHPGHHLVVVHVGLHLVRGGEGRVGRPAAAHSEEGARGVELLVSLRAAKGERVHDVGRVDELGRVGVLGRVELDVEGARDLAHDEVPHDHAPLGPVAQRGRRGHPSEHFLPLFVGHAVPLRVGLEELEEGLHGARGPVQEGVLRVVVRVERQRGEGPDVQPPAKVHVLHAVDARHLDVLAVVQVGELGGRLRPDGLQLSAPVAPGRKEVDEDHVVRLHVAVERLLRERHHLPVRVAVHIHAARLRDGRGQLGRGHVLGHAWAVLRVQGDVPAPGGEPGLGDAPRYVVLVGARRVGDIHGDVLTGGVVDGHVEVDAHEGVHGVVHLD